jgi:uncharacterized damage-inducible protein DinB
MTTALPDIQVASDEPTMLCEFLDFYRAVFIRKAEGLDEAQARQRTAASTLDILALVRHMAEVELWWLQTVFAGLEVTPPYGTDDDPDGDLHYTDADTLAEAITEWAKQVAAARAITAAAESLDTLAATAGRDGRVSLRWILIHLIEEYARHCGHADFIREAIDGQQGD